MSVLLSQSYVAGSKNKAAFLKAIVNSINGENAVLKEATGHPAAAVLLYPPHRRQGKAVKQHKSFLQYHLQP